MYNPSFYTKCWQGIYGDHLEISTDPILPTATSLTIGSAENLSWSTGNLHNLVLKKTPADQPGEHSVTISMTDQGTQITVPFIFTLTITQICLAHPALVNKDSAFWIESNPYYYTDQSNEILIDNPLDDISSSNCFEYSLWYGTYASNTKVTGGI